MKINNQGTLTSVCSASFVISQFSPHPPYSSLSRRHSFSSGDSISLRDAFLKTLPQRMVPDMSMSQGLIAVTS